MAKSQKYTAEMEQTLSNEAKARGGLDLASCNEIAQRAEFVANEVTGRSIIAKARSMGLPYNRVVRTTKTGQPVKRKDDIVIEIETALGIDGLDSLAKAEKPALRALADAVKIVAAQAA